MLTSSSQFSCACQSARITGAARPGPDNTQIFVARCAGCGAEWEKDPSAQGGIGSYIRTKPPRTNPDGSAYKEPKPEASPPKDIRPEGQPVESGAVSEPEPSKPGTPQDQMIAAVVKKLGPEAAAVAEQLTGQKFDVSDPPQPAEKPEEPVEPEMPEDSAEPEEPEDAFGDIVWQELDSARSTKKPIASPGDGAYWLQKAFKEFQAWTENEPEDVCPMRLLARVAAESQRIVEDLGWTEEQGSEGETS